MVKHVRTLGFNKDGYAINAYILDAASDVSSLPTDIGAGSYAYLADASKAYALSPSGAWGETQNSITFTVSGTELIIAH